MIGPFVASDGTDVYAKDSYLQWLWWLIVTVSAICAIVYVGVFINNATFEHTYTKHPSSPGTLTSERYTYYWWMYFFSTIVFLVVPLLAMLMILFRNVYGSNVFVTILLVICIGIHLVALVSFTGAYATCNHNGYPLNPCNDKLYCCVPDVYTDPVNDCPNVTPCIAGSPATIGELKSDPDFVWIYWLNVFYFILEVVLLGVIGVYWSRPPQRGGGPQGSSLPNMDDDEQDNIENSLPATSTRPIRRSLRKRTTLKT